MKVPAVIWVAALLAVGGALDGQTLLYLDNPSHLVEVDALAREILPGDHWFTGWSDGANLGHAVNQVNAPLIWAVCGGLVWAGLPLGAVYLAGIVLSNLVFALGCWRAGERWLGARALPGVLLAVTWATDLYGFGGAAGGMWPHRLANGIFLWGLGAWGGGLCAHRGRDAGSVGLWLGILLLCHTYTGMAGALLVGVAAGLEGWRLRGGGWRGAEGAVLRALAGGAVIGAVWTMPFWVPLLEEGLRPVQGRGGFRVWWLHDTLTWFLLPFHPVRRGDPRVYWYVGGWWAFWGSGVLVAALAVIASKAGREIRSEIRGKLGEIRAVAAAAAVMLALAAGVTQVLESDMLGPNPWRHMTLCRNLLHLIAGLGVGWLVERAAARAGEARRGLAGAGLVWGLGLGLGLGSLQAGRVEMSHGAELTGLQADLEQTWADLAGAIAEREAAGIATGQVFHQNTNLNGEGPRPLFFSEVGVLLSVAHRLPVVGTWYAITAVATDPHVRSQGTMALGRLLEQWRAQPGGLAARMDEFGIGAVVSVEEELSRQLSAAPGMREVSRHGNFAAWVRDGAEISAVDCLIPGAVGEIRQGRGWLDIGFLPVETLQRQTTADRAVVVTIRRTWHPWWEAWSVGPDGQRERLVTDRGGTTGLLEVRLRGPGRVEFRYNDPTRWTLIGAVPGLLAGLVLLWRGRQARMAPAS